MVGVGKHVCGAATDLGLRCLLPLDVSATESDVPTSGVAIALCCYHVCSWDAQNQKMTRYLQVAGDVWASMRAVSSCRQIARGIATNRAIAYAPAIPKPPSLILEHVSQGVHYSNNE